MVVGEITDTSFLNETLFYSGNESLGVVGWLIKEVGFIGLWLKTIGILFILWIIFEIAFLISARLRRKKLNLIEERLERIEKKIDKITKKG